MPEEQPATYARGGPTQLWEVPSFSLLETIHGTRGDIAFLDKSQLATGIRGVNILRVGQQKEPRCPGWVRQLALSPSGDLLAAVCDKAPGQILRWKLGGNECIELPPLVVNGTADNVAISRHGVLAIGDLERSNVYLFDPPHEKARVLSVSLPIRSSTRTTWITFSPTGKRVALGGADGTVAVANIDTGEVPLFAEGGGGRTSHEKSINELCFCGDDNTLVSAGGWDGRVKLWNIAKGRLIRDICQDTRLYTGIACSSDGKLIATGSVGGQIELWARDNGRRVGQLIGHRKHINGLAFVEDDHTLLSACSDRTLGVWDVTRLCQRLRIPGDTSIFECIAVSKDGRTVACGARNGTIRLQCAASQSDLEAAGWED
jgi:WD40 repeat protein